MRILLCFILVISCGLSGRSVFASCPLPVPLPAVKKLSHSNGKADEQVTFDSQGYAVKYRVPSEEKPWYAIELEIYGEIYGEGYNPKTTEFLIAFMDLEGNIYAESEHAFGDHFTGSPAWCKVKIKPTELPPEFWVVVNFRPERNKGVYIGYVNSGGGHSKLTDQQLNLREMEDPWDWCIDVKVRDEVKGKHVKYDPSNFKKKADPESSESKNPLAKKEATEHVVVEYEGLDDIWGKAVARLVETALEGCQDLYGLAGAAPIQVSAKVDAEVDQGGLELTDDGRFVWTLKNRNELLPSSRGGKHRHLFCFCRELVRKRMRENLVRSRYAPEGQEDGVAVYLGATLVTYVYKSCGKELWPVPFNYHMEEGPRHVVQWIREDADAPDRRFAALLDAVKVKVGEEKLRTVLRASFEGTPPARGWVKKLRDILEGEADEAWLNTTFPEEWVNPPVLWFIDRPDFKSHAPFAGLKAKRYKTQAILQYDDSACEGTQRLTEEGFLSYFIPPEGAWKLNDLRVYCKGAGTGAEGAVTVMALDSQLEALGAAEVPHNKIDGKKLKWQSLGGVSGLTITGPVYLVLFTGGEAVEVGYDEIKGRCHSAKFRPGSYVAPPEGKRDWMFRVYLEPEPAMDKTALDNAIQDLRRRLKNQGR